MNLKEESNPILIDESRETNNTITSKSMNNSVYLRNANPFWQDENKIRRAVEIFGSVLPRKRALEMISEEVGISIRLAQYFGSKLLNSNEYDSYINEVQSRPNGKEIYCYFNHLSNNKKYYDLNKAISTTNSNSTNNNTVNPINNENLICFNDEYDEEIEDIETYFTTNNSELPNNDFTYSNNQQLASNSNQINQNNDFNKLFNNLNNKLDYLLNYTKQTNVMSSNRNEPITINSNDNIYLSSSMFKTLMQCKKCKIEFTTSSYPKRATKCGHSICTKCFINITKTDNEESLLECPLCNVTTTWSRNTDLISILDEVQRNTTKSYLIEIERIKSSRLSETYSENFNNLLHIASEDLDKMSRSNQKLLFDLLKRKFERKQASSQTNSNAKRAKIGEF